MLHPYHTFMAILRVDWKFPETVQSHKTFHLREYPNIPEVVLIVRRSVKPSQTFRSSPVSAHKPHLLSLSEARHQRKIAFRITSENLPLVPSSVLVNPSLLLPVHLTGTAHQTTSHMSY